MFLKSGGIGMKRIKIVTPYITLGQFLKFADFISSGGETKFFLSENHVLVNNELELRRGRKLYPNDTVVINDSEPYIIER